MSDIYPIGTIIPYAGDITPEIENSLISQGFIPCDGRPLSKTNSNYASLLSVIGTTYGGDDKNFYIPDYRGLFLRGTDYSAGRDPDKNSRTAPRPDLKVPGNIGNKVGSMQKSGLKGHSHTYQMHSGYHICNYGSLIGPGVYTAFDTSSQISSVVGASETRPKNLYINFLICFQ